MATVIIDTRSKEAKKMLEYLKLTRYAKVFEEEIPNDETIAAIKEVEDGEVKTYNSVSEMIGLAQEPTVRSTAEDGDKLEVITVELQNSRALGILKSLEKAQMIKLHQLTEKETKGNRFKKYTAAGILEAYGNPGLTYTEKEAWTIAVNEKHGNH